MAKKLATAYRAFAAYCKARQETPMIKHFTKDNLGWESLRHFPQSSCKASDSKLILGFLLHFLSKLDGDADPVERDAFLAGKAIDDFLRICYTETTFLSREQAIGCVALLQVWSEKFYACALQCNRRELCFFSLTPKYHYVLHVCHDLRVQLLANGRRNLRVLNPAIFSAQVAEDYVGRSSRLVRTVRPATVSLRTAQKWLVQTKRLWDRELEK